EQNFSVICLCNMLGINPGGLANQVADIFLADQIKKSAGSVDATVPAISIPEKELASLTGLYVDPLASYNHRYYMKDGKLMTDVGSGFVLSPLSRNRFKVVGAPVEILF